MLVTLSTFVERKDTPLYIRVGTYENMRPVVTIGTESAGKPRTFEDVITECWKCDQQVLYDPCIKLKDGRYEHTNPKDCEPREAVFRVALGYETPEGEQIVRTP